MPEMQQRYGAFLPSSSSSSNASNNTADPHAANAIPPWVHISTSANSDADALIPPPGEILPNSRHYKPPPPHYRTGRKWDHLRNAEPAFLSSSVAEAQVRWEPFMHAGPNPRAAYGEDGRTITIGDGGARIRSPQWMEENVTGWDAPWKPEDELEAGADPTQQKGLMYKGMWFLSPERQERTVKWFWRVLLKNAFVPLGFRITVLAFSTAALALSASIYDNVQRVNHDSDPYNQCSSRASTYMGIVVDSIALPYIGYVTWDEYMSKPLGLRGVGAKIALLLCDLYFIVFSASNLSLAFDALNDERWACFDDYYAPMGGPHKKAGATCPNNPAICHKQKALAAVLVVSLVAWLITFSMSVLRVVEKLRPD